MCLTLSPAAIDACYSACHLIGVTNTELSHCRSSTKSLEPHERTTSSGQLIAIAVSSQLLSSKQLAASRERHSRAFANDLVAIQLELWLDDLRRAVAGRGL